MHQPFVDEQGRGRVRLEPDVAGRRRGPQDARQLPDPDLLHRPGEGPADGRHGLLQPALGPGEPAAGRPGPAGAGRPPAPLQLLDHPGGGRRGRRRPASSARPAQASPSGRAGRARGTASRVARWSLGRGRPRARPGSAAGGRRRRAGRAGRAGPGRARPSRPGRGARSRAGAGPRPAGPAAPWARWDGPPPSGCWSASRRRSWTDPRAGRAVPHPHFPSSAGPAATRRPGAAPRPGRPRCTRRRR